MRRIIQLLVQFRFWVYLFVQRFGLFCALLETARRTGLNCFSDRLLSSVVPTYRAWKRLSRVAPESVADLKVSVVIPVYNGIADGLEPLLESLRRQTHRNLEIVAVDSGSTDQSVPLLEQYGAKVVKIRKEEFRHDYARNLGAENAAGDFLLFTVCDCRFNDPQWIELGLRQMKCFGAVSYSTPQTYDDKAEPYARYLAYNFVAANRYSLGVNVFGNRLLGRPAFSLAGAQVRERAVHIDDTNHLVRKDFFLAHPYTSHTCEDMNFGTKVIRSGRKFVYSTLSQVQHYHSYKDIKKYFTRVFVDLSAINGFLAPYAPKKYYGIVDMTVNTAACVLGSLLTALRFHEENGAEKLYFGKAATPPEAETMPFSAIRSALSVKEPIAYMLNIKTLPEEVEKVLTGQLGLAFDPHGRKIDFRFLRAFHVNYVNHLQGTCRTLTELGYMELPLAEFKHVAVLSLLNYMAWDLCLATQSDMDASSTNLETLKRLQWM
jgi:glycosyltransferase involved in cell wall biosynthesis